MENAEVEHTSDSFPICNLQAAASASAGKAEPNLTEVIFTSAPKPRVLRRTGCPHLTHENA